MANIVLNSLTHVGRGVLNGIASYVNSGAGYIRGFRKLTAKVRADAGQDVVVSFKYEVPRLAAIEAGCCTPAGTAVGKPAIIDIRVRYDEFTSQTERDDVLKCIQDLVLTTQFVSAVKSLEQPAG